MKTSADFTPFAECKIFDARKVLVTLVRPDVAFLCIWALVFAAYSLPLVDYYPDPHWRVISMLAGSVVIGFASAYLWRRFLPHPNLPIELPAREAWPKLIYIGVAVWVVGFIAITVYSGGMPIYWYRANIPKTYVDYGLPTFSGAWNTFRVVLAIMTTLYLTSNRKLNVGLSLVLVFLTVTVICEINRGGFILYAMNVLAAAVLMSPTPNTNVEWKERPPSLFGQIVWVVTVVVVVLAGVVAMGNIRASDPKAAAAIDGAFDGAVPAGGVTETIVNSQAVAWVYTYLTTPVSNLHYAASQSITTPKAFAYHTLYPMLPSVIRPDIPPESRYPLPLLLDGYTMTTAYGSFVADFGFAWASVAMGLQLALSTLIFALARRHLWALVLAPMLFATAVLSFFTNYFFTLLLPFHAALAIGLAFVIRQLIRRGWQPLTRMARADRLSADIRLLRGSGRER